jgi:type I protein arginine methyltransferase
MQLQLSFSTSPFGTKTHWKQAVFYFDERLIVCKGEIFKGRLSCAPNSLNPRDLDFELQYHFNGKHSQAEGITSYRMR